MFSGAYGRDDYLLSLGAGGTAARPYFYFPTDKDFLGKMDGIVELFRITTIHSFKLIHTMKQFSKLISLFRALSEIVLLFPASA